MSKCQLMCVKLLHLGSYIISQSLDPLFDVVGQTVNLSSDKIQPVPLILPLLQAADPVKGQRSKSETLCD